MGSVEAVVAAATELTVVPRSRRWAHLSLCVLDAVFSIGARYETTTRTCCDYARAHSLTPLVEVDREYLVIGTAAEQPLDHFLHHVRQVGPNRFATTVLRNRQRTSPRGGVLKAEAAERYAAALVESGVTRFADLPELGESQRRQDALEAKLRAIPGNGASDVRLGYFWMLVGDDNTIKPDRLVLRWLERVVGRTANVAEARTVIAEAAARLGCSPWALDHAIWTAERARRPVIASDSGTVRRHRGHQGRWRDEVLGLPAGPALNPGVRVPAVDSMLPAAHNGTKAEEAGWNLMSDAAVRYAHARIPVIHQTRGVVEIGRLWRNMLSSQPLAFSIVGELRAHPDAALAALSEMTGRELRSFDRLGARDDPWALDGLQAEWAPRPEDHTGDRSAFDIAAVTRTEQGQRFLITIEVKYVDKFSSQKLKPDNYRRHLEAVGLDEAATQRLIEDGASQFLRSVLLTNSVRRGGRHRQDACDEVLAVVLSRAKDHSAQRVVERISHEIRTVPVACWSISQFLDTVSKQAALAEWADAVRNRYVPSE